MSFNSVASSFIMSGISVLIPMLLSSDACSVSLVKVAEKIIDKADVLLDFQLTVIELTN